MGWWFEDLLNHFCFHGLYPTLVQAFRSKWNFYASHVFGLFVRTSVRMSRFPVIAISQKSLEIWTSNCMIVCITIGRTIWLDFGVGTCRSRVTEVNLWNFRYWLCYRDISRTAWDVNFKLGDSMYHHMKTIWLEFEGSRSKVKGHRGQLSKLQVMASLSWYLKNHLWYKLQTWW